MPLEIVRNDITKMQVDAIVNTANPRPSVGGGVDRAIHQAAGAELLAARKEIGDIATGEAVITPAFKLSADYVIHTVGPVWQDGKPGERELLASCYIKSLQLAAAHKCQTIAFPLISAGVFGCPAEIALAMATQAIRDFLKEHDLMVYLVVFDRRSFRISSSLFEDVQSYLDETYVDERLTEEYRGDSRNRAREAQIFFDAKACMPEEDAASLECCKRATSRSLSELLDEIDDTFSEALLRLIDAKSKTDPEVYKKANIDRKLFSKIRNNPQYQPSKTTALAFAIALELNLDETRDFIGRAGFAISHSNKLDIIVEYFIKRGEYDIFLINDTLFSFQQPLLGC